MRQTVASMLMRCIFVFAWNVCYNVQIIVECINRLFAYYKGGNFNIHIFAWLGYFIC